MNSFLHSLHLVLFLSFYTVFLCFVFSLLCFHCPSGIHRDAFLQSLFVFPSCSADELQFPTSHVIAEVLSQPSTTLQLSCQRILRFTLRQLLWKASIRLPPLLFVFRVSDPYMKIGFVNLTDSLIVIHRMMLLVFVTVC